ncbi:MAG: hypothetical protein ACLU9S_11205 [Oscillospiraceae bacterium]
MSSHVLSEIQRNCTRAAVIRDGRIIACDRVEALSKTSAKRVTVHGIVNLEHLHGVRARKTSEHTVSFLYSGDMGTLAAHACLLVRLRILRLRSLIWKKFSCTIMKRTVKWYDACKARTEARKNGIFDLDGVYWIFLVICIFYFPK